MDACAGSMRALALPSAVIACALLLSACATVSSPSPPLASADPSSTTPRPGTVRTHAPDPPQATIHESWAYDVTDVREVIRNADAVVAAEVTSIDAMGTFQFAEGGLPMTGVSLAERGVLRGDVLNGDVPRQVTIYVLGGTVTLQQVFKSQSRESSEKSGIADMDEAERRSTTVEYVPQGPVRLEPHRERIYARRVRGHDRLWPKRRRLVPPGRPKGLLCEVCEAAGL